MRGFFPSLMLAVSGMGVQGQSVFNPQGGEYSVLGAAAGDQVYPSVAIGRETGYLVWQDNTSASGRSSVRALRLDGAIPDAYGAFQVNESQTGNDERPKVVLLANGGAMVVWQRRDGAGSDVFARFMRPDGTFAGGEVAVNEFSSGDQLSPVAAALTDGGVVVVWFSFGQDGSMGGIFARLFSNQGLPLGAEFQVNVTTPFNQRDPAVASLSGGGFVVAWVSEQQRFALSVDVYGRVYNAQGQAQGGELRLNATNQLAMTPAVSGRADGGFVAAWMERDEATAAHSWDIWYANFSADGQRLAEPVRANEHLFGDQFSPVLSSSGYEHVLAWTSLGQDGSQEGIYARFIGVNGALTGSETPVNSTHVNKQMQPTLAADGYGRLLAVWTGFYDPPDGTGSAGYRPSSMDLFAQAYDAVRPVPTPGAPLVHALSGDALGITWPRLLGFVLSGYEVFVDGAETPVFATVNSTSITGLQPGSTHSVALRYVLADGRRSALSPAATGTTWGADLNGDGLPDGWQTTHFGKTAAGWPSPGSDTDGDGASDLAEFLAGTDPQNPASALRSEMKAVGGELRFEWTARPGFVYQVQVSTNFTDWVNVGLPRFATGDSDGVPMVPSGTAAFYRVIRVR